MNNLSIQDCNKTIILGIDPGTYIMGFGIIKSEKENIELIYMEELILKKYHDHFLKLKIIFNKTIMLIDNYLPKELAVESAFFGKNVQSMLKLGRTQGVAIAAGMSREIPIAEYSPRKIKMSITGNGNASKEQVAESLKNLLNLKNFPTKHLDASDGLATAVCHHVNRNMLLKRLQN